MLRPSRVDKKGQRGLFYGRTSAESMAQTPLYRFSKQFLRDCLESLDGCSTGAVQSGNKKPRTAILDPAHYP